MLIPSHISSAIVLVLILLSRIGQAQDRPLAPPPPYMVQVIPKNNFLNRTVIPTSFVETFYVQNIGNNSDTYTITCRGTGVIACTNVSQSSLSLGPGEQQPIAATYTKNGGGTGTLWLKANDEDFARDSGSYAITVGAPIVDSTPYNYAGQIYSRCAQSCFAVIHSQATVPYFSLDAPRYVALTYNSDRVNPKIFVHLNVSPDPGDSPPSEYQLKVKVNDAYVTFRNSEQTLRFTNPAPGTDAVRIAGQIDAAT